MEEYKSPEQRAEAAERERTGRLHNYRWRLQEIDRQLHALQAERARVEGWISQLAKGDND